MEGTRVFMIEQNLLPFEFRIFESEDYQKTCSAIKTMIIRGAGAIGAAAGFAMAQACLLAPEENYSAFIEKAKREIESTRPTARNLFYATERVYKAGQNSKENAFAEAQMIADEDASASYKIGFFGKSLIHDGSRLATHCNAGWLAFVDNGTALSPIYQSAAEGKNIFVYVDETRPRSQGARLTAWELHNEHIPHAIIPDNATAYYMSKGLIDLMIVGADRIAANGDVANKIGTLEKAIIAREYRIPFYVAAPASTFDINCPSGDEIAIEERDPHEVLWQEGIDKEGRKTEILVCSPGSPAYNPAFDVSPARFITGFITEKGIIRAHPEDIKNLLSHNV